MRPKLDSGENLLRDAMRVAIPVEEPEKVAARREALLKVIERQVALSPARVHRSESRRKWIQGSRWGMAAAVLVLAVGVGMLVQSQKRESESHRVADAMPAHGSAQGARIAHQGEALSTSSGEKQRLRLPGDTVVSVGERTGLRLIEAMPKRQVMDLDHGRIDVDVNPAAAGVAARYVSVRTPHAVVEVKGTIFSVDVHPIAGDPIAGDSTAGYPAAAHNVEAGKNKGKLATTVSVQRGAVVVHSVSGDLTLRAGDSWTSSEVLLPQSDVSKPKLVAHTVKVPPRASGKKPLSETVSSEPALQTPAVQRPSTLAEENELLERVIVAAESGQQERALKLCDDFLGRYPRSPLRATVMAKRNQLLSR